MICQLRKSRRVLMTVDAVGGVWRYALDLAQALVPLGHEVVFAGFGPAPGPAQRREAEAIGEVQWCRSPLDWLATHPEELAGVADEIAYIVDRCGIETVHLNLPSQAVGLHLPVPVITVSHSCLDGWFRAVKAEPLPPRYSWLHDLTQQGFAAADLIVAPSESHAADLQRDYADLPPVEVVHNASATSPSCGMREEFVFAAGRWWDEGKNAASLEAAARLAQWPVVAAGPNEGPEGQRAAFCHVRYRGAMSHQEVEALMGCAAIFVSPSFYEPFGLAALEAARSGAALVLADIPTYRELWDGAALFAAPHEGEAFAAAINRLAEDGGLRAAMAQKAGERARRYTLERQAAAMDGLYARAAERHKIEAAE